MLLIEVFFNCRLDVLIQADFWDLNLNDLKLNDLVIASRPAIQDDPVTSYLAKS